MSSKRHIRRKKCEKKIRYPSYRSARSASTRFVEMGGDLLDVFHANLDAADFIWDTDHRGLRVSELEHRQRNKQGAQCNDYYSRELSSYRSVDEGEMSGAYYNDNDPFVCAWLRELIKADLIAPGEVDERSIEEVKPDDLRGFTQCHFFAGIGVWSYALRNAGWADATPVWTGSCPCQGFSASGQRGGFSDKRHLWPAWFRLISECRPVTVFGEQVASKDGLAWLDVVSADMEGAGYAIGAADTCAAGFGAPHIRQRLYFVADALPAGRAEGWSVAGNGSPTWRGIAGECSDALRSGRQQVSRGAFGDETADGGARWNGSESNNRHIVTGSGETGGGSDSDGRNPSTEGLQRSGQYGLCSEDCRTSEPSDTARNGRATGLSESSSRQEGHTGITNDSGGECRAWRGPGWLDPITARSIADAGATRGFWSDCDWWYGRDGKYRPIGAGLFPLVAGATGRMGKLRGYGNAICAPQAQGFIEAYMTI